MREGGVLVYSTCTFSYQENEGIVKAFLQGHPEFAAEEIPAVFGRVDMDGGLARRVYPMDGGEGHFVARFRRVGENACRAGSCREELKGSIAAMAGELMDELFTGGGPHNNIAAMARVPQGRGLPEPARPGR